MRGGSAGVALVILGLIAGGMALGQDAAPAPKLGPRRVTLADRPYSVAEILAAIEAQSGNRAEDRRTHTSPEKIDFGLKDQTYWQALDRLTSKLDARISLYGEGSPALVDGSRRGGYVAFENVCRFEIKSVDVQRNFETDRRSCVVDLEIAWEPGFEPLYMTVDQVRGKFAADARGKQLEFGPIRGVSQSVAQRRAQVVDLRLPGPDRTSPKISSLVGEIKFVGTHRMLSASFKNLKVGPNKQKFVDDGVTVDLGAVKVTSQFWAIDLEIVNPASMPAFESFQSWLDNNRIHLERDVGGKKEIWLPRPNDSEISLAGRNAKVTYRFFGLEGKGPLGDWTVVYRTPGRMGVFTIPFEFKDVDLP